MHSNEKTNTIIRKIRRKTRRGNEGLIFPDFDIMGRRRTISEVT